MTGPKGVGTVRRTARIVAGALLVAGSLVALGVLTRFEYRTGTDDAALRMAWRTPVPRAIECRTATAQEQAELPIHMRQDEICEGRALSYRLEVRVDGEVRHRSRVAATGARGDRPLHVFEELRLVPGERRIRIAFERTDSAGPTAGDAAVLEGVVFDRRLRVEAREVVLVTYDADRKELVRRDRTGR